MALSTTTPLMAVPSGPHQLVVTYNGHHHLQVPFLVAPTQLIDVAAEPEETLQRKLAYASIGTAGVTAGAAVVFGVLSVIAFRRSRDLLFDEGVATQEDFEKYVAAVSAADDFRVGSGTTGGIALGLFVVGATLFAFDEPVAPSVGRAENAGRIWFRVGF